ncbi:substrate-binding periplasmic protein [Zooshikella sp. RANM57]|uniref:substrate-binding periplasmic protein n=1 Tax=Zooshikella sp. RANM57 TaxID=3425863 RepID=UPI003D6F9CB1
MKHILTFLFILLCGHIAIARTVDIGYTPHGLPFDEEKGDKLIGGLIYDIASLIVSTAKLEPVFHSLPVNRIEDFLASGHIQMLCLYNPNWLTFPEHFTWGPALLRQREFFIIRQQDEDITHYEQLKSFNIGSHLGYIYSDTLMSLFDDGKATRISRRSTAELYKLIQLKRVNVIIDNDYSFFYLKRQGKANGLQLASLIDNIYPLHCALSQKKPKLNKELLSAINIIANQNDVTKVLTHYKQYLPSSANRTPN